MSLSELFGIDPSTLSGIRARQARGRCANLSPCPNVTQYLFATQEAQQINFPSGGCTTGRLRNAVKRESLRSGARGRVGRVSGQLPDTPFNWPIVMPAPA